jgi:hypothetical protein
MCTRAAIRAGVVVSILAGLSAGAASAQAADQDWAAPVSEPLESLAKRGVSIRPKGVVPAAVRGSRLSAHYDVR